MSTSTRKSSSPSKVFGRSLRRARASRGLSQARLAELADCSEDAVGRIERGTMAPTITLASRLARVVEVDVGHLLGGMAPRPAPKIEVAGRDLLDAVTGYIEAVIETTAAR